MTPASTQIPQLSGLSAVADRYDGFILDLWGVIHNGEELLEGVADCLERLVDRGKRICLLSNAPRRTGGVFTRLDEMGLDRRLYHHVMTSGEATHEALRDRHGPHGDPWHAALGRRFYHIGPDRDRDVFEGLPLEQADRPAGADFVLNTGIVVFGEQVEDYLPVLEEAAERRLPMICANPDLVVEVGSRMVICAGLLASRYEDLGGGPVHYHGKPHAPVYRRCFDLLGLSDRSRILAVGDSLRTDVAGANAAAIDSALVTGGIHREELGGAWGEHPDPARLTAAVEASGHTPTWALPRLVW